MALQVNAFGPAALLVRFAETGDAEAFLFSQALLEHLERHPLPGLMEVTPGVTTLLLEFERGSCPAAEEVQLSLASVSPVSRHALPARPPLLVPVIYDGPDLSRIAERTGLSIPQIVLLHTSPVYRVQILGFSPGFPYLVGLDPRLICPRLETPRPRVPAGSVAIAAEYASIYPVATAGGWNLLGRTDLVLMDRNLALAGDVAAFRFQPGDAVRFVAVRGGEASHG